MTRRGFFKLFGAASVGAAVSPWAWLTTWFTKPSAIDAAINYQVVTAPMVAGNLFRSSPMLATLREPYVWVQLDGHSNSGVVGTVMEAPKR